MHFVNMRRKTNAFLYRTTVNLFRVNHFGWIEIQKAKKGDEVLFQTCAVNKKLTDKETHDKSQKEKRESTALVLSRIHISS